MKSDGKSGLSGEVTGVSFFVSIEWSCFLVLESKMKVRSCS
jgi:hypothetical protein